MLVVEIVLADFSDGISSFFGIEFATDKERSVANTFGFEAFAIGPTEESVFGILFGMSEGRKLVGSTEGNLANE